MGMESITGYNIIEAEDLDAAEKIAAECPFISTEAAVPGELRLEQNFPNPFNPVTNIRYLLPEASTVSLEVYNLLGQRAATLVNRHQTAGAHTVTWNGRDDSGRALASGV